ncbi:MAG: gluconolaconase [Acidobacteriota bacterium]
MNKAGEILSISPPRAIPGGEIAIECVGFNVSRGGDHGCTVGGQPSRLVAASTDRMLAVVPANVERDEADLMLVSEGETSTAYQIAVGEKLIDEMHIVANPAIDPKDDSLIVTRSGSRGQSLPTTLFRVEADGYLDEMPAEVMNPTGVAFDREGTLFVTNRSDGWVVRIERGEDATTYAAGLGVATGIAFDNSGIMYVGDRSGTVHRIPEPGYTETFAVLEPSVAAYHMAFGPDDRLYLTAPALASHDAVHVIEQDGTVDTYFRGFGRPQGLAFDVDGNLYVAASYKGRQGIVLISPGAESAEMFVAGRNIVGLCFTRAGDMVVATNDTAYSLPLGIYGTLLE